jgi:hypothetical protein
LHTRHWRAKLVKRVLLAGVHARHHAVDRLAEAARRAPRQRRGVRQTKTIVQVGVKIMREQEAQRRIKNVEVVERISPINHGHH